MTITSKLSKIHDN